MANKAQEILSQVVNRAIAAGSHIVEEIPAASHAETARAEHLPVEWNYIATGGMFGRVRRLPGFTIRKNDSGRFYVTSDTTGFTVSGGHSSPECAERCNLHRKPQPMGE